MGKIWSPSPHLLYKGGGEASNYESWKFPTNWYYDFWCGWSSILKVPKIASLQDLYNISKKKCKMKLIFCMQVNIKVTFKLISTLCASNVLQGDTIIIDGWAWSSILKVFKVTSLQNLYNISKRRLGKEFIFLHLDKLQSFYKLVLSFLMEVARHFQSTQIGSW